MEALQAFNSGTPDATPLTVDNNSVRPPTETRPQLFLVERYQLLTFRGDLARDEQIGNIPAVEPHTTVTYKIITKKAVHEANTLTSTVLDSQDQRAVTALNQSTKQSADSKAGNNHYDYQMDANFHGEGSIGFGSGTADADVHAKGSTNEVRNEFAESTASAIDSQVSQVNEVRRERISTATGSVEIDEQTETAVEKTTTNETSQIVNIGIFQVKEEHFALLSLVVVEFGFTNGDATINRTVPLTRIDSVLNEVVARDEDKKFIKKQIRTALQYIRDYQGDPKSIIVKDPLDKNGIMINTRLESKYQLRKPDGSLRRTVVAPGIIIKAFRRYLRKPNITVELPIVPV